MILTKNDKLRFVVKENTIIAIREYVRVILDTLEKDSVEIYLFGSIAKGGYTEYSDIDLLVIVKDRELDSEQKRSLRIELNGLGCDVYFDKRLPRELDCKVYGEIDFSNSTKTNFFEKDICKDLIRVTEWR